MRTAKSRKQNHSSYLDGQLLVAMPLMTDKRFARSVIYMCAHSDKGAMGLIVNQKAPHISFRELLRQLNIPAGDPEGDDSSLIELDVHVVFGNRTNAS